MQFHCVLPGSEQPPASLAKFRVRMGANKRSEFFFNCPIGTSRTDEVEMYLAAFNYHEDFGEWPPGRRDPKVVKAFQIIKKEIEDSLTEKLPSATSPTRKK